MVPLLYLVLSAEVAMALLLLVKTWRSLATSKTVGCTILVLLLSSGWSILKIWNNLGPKLTSSVHVALTKLGPVIPTDQVLQRTHLPESTAVIGILLLAFSFWFS